MSTVEAQTGQEQITVCPQCRSAESWGQNSWCPSCGYYPKFAADKQGPVTVDRTAVEPADQELEQQAESSMPAWLKVLVGGVFLILVANVGVRIWLHFNGGRRAMFSLIEMVLGLALCGGANVAAWMECRKSDKRTGIADIVTNPFTIWQPILERMPRTRKLVWFAAWGLTMVVAANLIVGGIKYSGLYTNDWGFEQPKAKKMLGDNIALNEDKELQEAVEEYQEKVAAGLPADPPKIDVVVYGVLADDSYEMGRILTARSRSGILKHAALLKGADLEEDVYEVLLRRVNENLAAEPAVRSALNATWVEPTIYITLTFEDLVQGGELVAPTFHKLKENRASGRPADSDATEESDESQPGDEASNSDTK